jgi:hypothetical protein
MTSFSCGASPQIDSERTIDLCFPSSWHCHSLNQTRLKIEATADLAHKLREQGGFIPIGYKSAFKPEDHKQFGEQNTHELR